MSRNVLKFVQKIKKYGSTKTGCAIMEYLKRIIYTGGSSRMVSFTYIIKDKFGIHARPGLLLVQEAGKLTSNITIFKGTDSGDAKRMFCVMNLAVKQGDQITVHVEGENEEADAEVMREFLKNNL
jgi:phosphocarrier protein HPr